MFIPGCPYTTFELLSTCETPINSASFNQEFKQISATTYAVSTCEGVEEVTISHVGFEDVVIPISDPVIDVPLICSNDQEGL